MTCQTNEAGDLYTPEMQETMGEAEALAAGKAIIAVKVGRSEMGALIRQGFRRGRRARWLIDRDWEELLERPLDQLREELRIGDPPRYEQVRSAAAPPRPSPVESA